MIAFTLQIIYYKSKISTITENIFSLKKTIYNIFNNGVKYFDFLKED